MVLIRHLDFADGRQLWATHPSFQLRSLLPLATESSNFRRIVANISVKAKLVLAFKELDPIPQFRATAKLGRFLGAAAET